MSWLSKLVVPQFPPYPGAHSVGTCDVEIPVTDVRDPVETDPKSISTVAFRIFYPSDPDSSSSRPVRWVPKPQQHYIAAYAQLAGANAILASIFR